MNRLGIVVTLVLGMIGHLAFAGEIACFPPSLTLEGPHAAQSVVIVETLGEFATKDLGSSIRLSIKDSGVARIAEDRTILPVGNGATELLATTEDGKTVTASIVVKGFTDKEDWSFTRHVVPVLTRAGCNMGSCHGASAGKNGLRLSLRGYAPEADLDALSRQASGRRINKRSPAESLMLLKPTGALDHGGGVRFTTDSLEYRVLSEWIAGGMPRPKMDEPGLFKVLSMPKRVQGRRGETQNLVVQAQYTDGRVADVTRWAKFASTDETVAKVDESGRVTVEGEGEAAITVWFSSLVDSTLVSVPSSSPVDPKIFESASRSNPIDALNLKKLASLGIPPSPACSDEEFLRRAYLDCTGTLPSVEDINSFVESRAVTKRAQLVDRLLGGDEYVDYWTYKWSDLLLVSSKSLPVEAMWSFSRAIRRAVTENVPWDEFARRVITAKGSTLVDGFANYFVLHRDPIDLTESSSMAFLGMSLTCARCHNHPMEKWTQDQYYGMANLFSRVVLRDGSDRGDVVVSAGISGEVIHPRKGVAMVPQPLDADVATLKEDGDRRVMFAEWLASPSNPYFDRAIINRVWRNFFGRGLIEPEDDLRATNPASDEAIMAWLIDDFRMHHRDLKHLIRTIMTSSSYSRSSEPVPGNAHDLRFLSHYVPRRLPAEVLLDAISQVAESPESYPGFPEGWRSLQLPDAQVASTFLNSFGRPERVSTCSCERSAEPSIAQALNLANGETLNQKLRNEKGVVARLVNAGATDAMIIETMFKTALGRMPTDTELTGVLRILKEARESSGAEPEKKRLLREAVEDLYWSILTSREFLFNH